MVRIKRGTMVKKGRRTLFSQVKGYRLGRSKKVRDATTAALHAGVHAFAHRRKKKGDFKKLWIVKINALARKSSTNYSKLISSLKKQNIKLNTKVLSELAKDNETAFKKIVDSCK